MSECTASAARDAIDPTRTLAALAIGCQVAKSFRYLLTDHLKFDILHPAPAGRGPNAI
jgi:hypothetical protein